MRHESLDALRLYIIGVRQAKNLSQVEVARRGGFPRGTLATIEAGRGTLAKPETLARVAKGLGVPYETLDRIARGLPPDGAAIASEVAELMALWDQVPGDRREAALRMLRGLAE